ncbi:MAG: hypothetical protein J6U54_07960 [Clostridiales bacterium]|nr:hypothetical protein [Clostridiales bacterium]
MTINIFKRPERKERKVIIISEGPFGIYVDTKRTYMTDDDWDLWKFNNIEMKKVDYRWIDADTIAIIKEKKEEKKEEKS